MSILKLKFGNTWMLIGWNKQRNKLDAEGIVDYVDKEIQ